MSHHLYIKILLVVLIEGVAIAANKSLALFTNFNIPDYIILIIGAAIGYFVVSVYNKNLVRKKNKIEKELTTLTNIALQRYYTNEK